MAARENVTFGDFSYTLIQLITEIHTQINRLINTILKIGILEKELKRAMPDSPRYPSHGFNGSVNISENCKFRSQDDPVYLIL